MSLFCDCKTDEEKSNFFLSGRAFETGIIAYSISNDVAMAYHRCAQFKKENDELCAKVSDLTIDVEYLGNLKKSYEELIGELQEERDELRVRIAAMEQQEPYAFAVNFPESSRVELVHDLDEAYEDMTYEAYEVRKLYLAPGART